MDTDTQSSSIPGDAANPDAGRSAGPPAAAKVLCGASPLYMLVEQSPTAMALFDRHMNYLAASLRWVEIYGRGHAELVGLNHYDLHPDLPAEWKRVHRKALAGEKLSKDDDHWVQADGSHQWMRWSAQPWMDEQGAIGGILISVEDITERKHAEWRLLRLADAVERIAAVRSHAELMTILRYAARELTGADGAALVLREGDECHYVDEEAIGPLWKGQRLPLHACIAGWSMVHAVPAVIEDVYADPRIPAEAYRSTFVRSLSMVPIGRAAPVGAIGCYWAQRHQATDREVGLQQALADAAAIGLANLELYRRLEDGKRTAELAARETRESEMRFRSTFEQAAVGIAHVTIDGRWLRVNSRLCGIVGYTREELLAEAIEDISHPDDYQRDEAQLQRILACQIETYSNEKRYLHKDGHIVWTHLTVNLVRYDDGSPAYFIAMVEDIQRRKEAEEKLRQQAAVFSNAQEGIVITDPECVIVAVNQAFTTITEYTEAEVKGQHMRIVQSGRHDRSFYQNMWSALLSTGAWQGEIWNRRKSGEIYLEWISISAIHDEHGKVANYVGITTDISRMKHAQTELERLAHHDALTGLPNRLLLSSRLEHAIERVRRHGGMGAVLFIDLDRFKQVNDSLGHRAGDELLQLVATRLRERLRDIDTLARLGGDEFVALLEDIPDAVAAEVVAREIIRQLQMPFPLSCGHDANIGASVGIALFPAHGDDATLLVEQADQALYDAKDGGRGRHKFFSSF
ncbi:MAG: PAS domain S-box protein [Zoogloea sp.]|nr:PAS domain S-box protein [Zoogloea sp.]